MRHLSGQVKTQENYDLNKHHYKQQLNKALLDLDPGQNGMFRLDAFHV